MRDYSSGEEKISNYPLRYGNAVEVFYGYHVHTSDTFTEVLCLTRSVNLLKKRKDH